MRVLVVGATGFIGARLVAALRRAGHAVIGVARRPPPGGAGPVRWIAADLAADPPPPWRDWLGGVDAVVNAAGVFREDRRGAFDALHAAGPIALFDACAAAGVRRVIQVSALGAAGDAPTGFLATKSRADEHLLALPLDGTVVLPSLVFGAEGASAKSLLTLAAWPVVPMPAGGLQRVQPVHVDDVAAALIALLQAADSRWRGRRVALVGPAPVSLREYLLALRSGLGMGPPWTVHVPAFMVQAAARAGGRIPGALLDTDAWKMLQQGSAADPRDITALLGRPPCAPRDFIPAGAADALRTASQLGWLLPLLRLSLALVWIATGIVSLSVYPVADSLELLARAGVPQPLRPAALYGAAALDLLLGALTLWPLRRGRHRVWAAQAALMVGYMAVITVRLPEYWAHPYGPLTKNLPMLAVLALLWALEPRRTR